VIYVKEYNRYKELQDKEKQLSIEYEQKKQLEQEKQKLKEENIKMKHAFAKEQKRTNKIIHDQTEYLLRFKSKDNLTSKGYYYIITSKMLAKNGHFKCGHTKNIKSRKSSYNTALPDTKETCMQYVYQKKLPRVDAFEQ